MQNYLRVRFFILLLLFCLALQTNESFRLHYSYGPPPVMYIGRPILPIKYFIFLQISLHKIPPAIPGFTSEFASLVWLQKVLFGILSASIPFTSTKHFNLFILVKDTKFRSPDVFSNSLFIFLPYIIYFCYLS